MIGRVGGARLEIGLGVRRAVLPACCDVLGHAGNIAGDGFGEAAAEGGFASALCQSAGVIAIEEIFERRQALQRHALGRKRRGFGYRRVLFAERLAHLARAEALGVGPIEDALVTMLLGHWTEADGLDQAPGFHRGGEGFFRILERRF